MHMICFISIVNAQLIDIRNKVRKTKSKLHAHRFISENLLIIIISYEFYYLVA